MDLAISWAKIYDMFAARYGLTIDKFYEFTLRQIMYAKEAIEDASYDDLALQAKLHKMKVKPRPRPLKLSKNERKEADEYAQSTLERMQAEFKLNQAKENN